MIQWSLISTLINGSQLADGWYPIWCIYIYIHQISDIIYRLVVWNMFFYFPFHIWDVILPNWLIFFKMLETTNQFNQYIMYHISYKLSCTYDMVLPYDFSGSHQGSVNGSDGLQRAVWRGGAVGLQPGSMEGITGWWFGSLICNDKWDIMDGILVY